MRSFAVPLLSALVAGNALVRGGVDAPAVACSVVLAAAALFAALVRGRRSDPAKADGAVELPLLVPGLALLTLAVAFQLLPLPPAVLGLLSPSGADLLARHLGPIGAYPSARPLSLDPGATGLELAKSAAWAAAGAAAALLAADRARRDALVRAIALCGPAVVTAVYAGRLFFNGPLLEPSFPFVNPNHLAGFLQLAAWPALGFALRERGPARVGWLVAFAFTASGIFLSLSRGGIAAFVVGTGLFVALYLRAGERRASEVAPAPRRGFRELLRAGPRALLRTVWTRSASFVPVAISVTLALAAFLAFDRVMRELRTVAEASTTEVKLGLWPSALQILRDFPLAGIGRGAFASVFPAYKWEPLQATFTHVENEWLQLPVDLGLVVGGGAILLFAWVYLSAASRREISRPVIGLLAGVGAVVAQNTFDFSLEISGVAIPFAIAMGVLAREMRTVRAPAWTLRAGALGAVLLAAAGLLLHHLHPPEADGRRVAATASADDALAAARELLPWHPADWVLPAAVGTKLAGELRCDEAEPWLLRAMERNPTAPEPHRGAARCYALRGNGRLAKREYRLAFAYGAQDALAEAHDVFPGKGELLEIAPDSPAGLVAAARILADDPEQAHEAWRRAWESFGEPRALAGLAAVTLAEGDADLALELARRLQQVEPQGVSGYVLAARALDAKGDDDAAVEELTAGMARFPGRAELLVPLGVHHLQKRRFSQARVVFEKILAREGGAVARKKVLVARALEGQERWGEALRTLQDAHDAAPDDPGPLEALSRVSARSGRYDDAIQALETAARKPGVVPGRYDAELDRLRTARTTAWAKPADPAGAGVRGAGGALPAR